jgi:alpha-amylase
MTSVCLYFKLHRPFTLKKYLAQDVDTMHNYEDSDADRASIDQLADECCLPANEIILEQLQRHDGKFRVSYAVSGVMLELFQRYRPDVIESFRKMVLTGYIDFLAETYYHSLSSLYLTSEFQHQVIKHSDLVWQLFNINPAIFRNTGLVHNNRIAALVSNLGYSGILCEGVERVLQGRSCNQLYTAPGNERMTLLLRNSTLSDDIAFRYGDPNWSEHPLTAGKFAGWLHRHPRDTAVINLFMDYETFGIHKKPAGGIFDFVSGLPGAVLADENFIFSTPSRVISENAARDTYDVSNTISWEDKSNTNCVWCENMMQNNTLKKIYSIEKLVTHADAVARDTWGRLQSADYFYYMDEQPGKYVHPRLSPKEAFQQYRNIVTDFEISLIRQEVESARRTITEVALV